MAQARSPCGGGHALGAQAGPTAITPGPARGRLHGGASGDRDPVQLRLRSTLSSAPGAKPMEVRSVLRPPRRRTGRRDRHQNPDEEGGPRGWRRSPAPAMFGEPTCSNPWARDHGVHLARSQPPSLDERQPTRSTNSAAVPLVALEFARSAPSASFVDLGVGVGVIAIEMCRRYWTLHVVRGPRSGYRESSPTTWSRSPLRPLKASPRIPRPALHFASRADQSSISFQVEVTNHAPRPRGAERPVTRYFLLDAHVEWRVHQVARSSRRAAGIKCLTRA